MDPVPWDPLKIDAFLLKSLAWVHAMLVSGYRADNNTEVHFFAPLIVQMPQDDRIMRSSTGWALGQWKLDHAPGPPSCVFSQKRFRWLGSICRGRFIPPQTSGGGVELTSPAVESGKGWRTTRQLYLPTSSNGGRLSALVHAFPPLKVRECLTLGEPRKLMNAHMQRSNYSRRTMLYHWQGIKM